MLVHVQGVQVGTRSARVSHIMDPATCKRHDLPDPGELNVQSGLPDEHTVRFDVESHQLKEL